MQQYQKLKEQHQYNAAQINKRYNLISAIRLMLAIGIVSCIYFYSQYDALFFVAGAILLIGLFLFLIKTHQKLSWQKKVEHELIDINQNEIDHLMNGDLPFENGLKYNDPRHAYSFDLDIFGEKSLFQNLNRTGTYSGESKLASSLLSIQSQNVIIKNQEAIKELSNKIEWRQKIWAIARVNQDSEESFENLMNWAKKRSEKITTPIRIISFVSPLLTIGLFTAYNLLDNPILLNLGLLLFVINLLVLASQLKRVSQESVGSGKIDKVLKQYSLIIAEIEHEEFQSERLRALKEKLGSSTNASQSIAQLSSLFGKMDNIMNAFSWIFNGILLYHLHTLHALQKWKNNNADNISIWLEIIGEFEALSSLANFSYNNTQYIFPEINNNNELAFEDLGHPLLNQETMVTNSVSFSEKGFFILTGSNMSGKSTFLRTLGINMILGSIGAPICASKGSIHPLPVLVSMRLSDSLSDSESYFFAEVKRLKEIMSTLDQQKCFVLLDEILRGTNSDDKRTGTIGVIEKMISKNVTGAIATHDLEVCLTTDQYPEILVNKCFEVEIVNNELHFDYKLRDGICQNKSATFLMEKMEIIAS
ncbi:MAG: DNA mismatch repair protein [Ekhidna sp.]